MKRTMEWLPESVGGLVGLVIAVPLIYLSIVRNLPRDLKLTPIEEAEIPLELFSQMARYEDLGFERLGAWRIHIAPAPTAVAYFRPDEGTFGMVFCVKRMPGKVFCDFSTALLPEPCALTSGMHIGGGSLTLADPDFLQLFPGASVEELHALHQEGVAYLGGAGLALAPPDPDGFEQRLRDAIRRQREAFGQAPVRNTFATLWRVVSQSSPYRGPIRRQKGTPAKLEAALGRRSRDEVFARSEQ
ncbi:MAG: hypothetical protein ACYTDU_08575 [Planctomycetota bacterium]|jgi:hypothetical protein